QKIWHLLNEARGAEKSGLPMAFDELVKKVIKPSLQENKVIIIDRYIDSTLVYQGLAGGLGVNVVQEIAKKTIDLPFPDITFILDIDPQKAQERLKKRRLETELKRHFPERIYLVDAEKSESEILAEVQDIIKQTRAPKSEACWNFPGGKIEHGETPEAAACREVFEENNLTIENCQKIAEENVFYANLPPGNQH
ncbi:34894_t:CDS:2, partial [Gigaspora margarita]